MAQPNRRRVREARNAGRPLRDANFLPKSQRKQVRKGMVRAYLANKVSEVRQEQENRAEFYRNLRVLKQNRQIIAREMAKLCEMVNGLKGVTVRVNDRLQFIRFRGDEAQSFIRELQAAADDADAAMCHATIIAVVAAQEFAVFSKKRVYYAEVTA